MATYSAGIIAGPVTETPISVGTSSTAVLSANSNRQYLQLINDSDTIMYISFGGTASANTGTRLNASGGTIVFDRFIPIGTITAINATGTKTLLVTEG